jgi:hypothetical protein
MRRQVPSRVISVGDQLVSSATNILVVVAFARESDPELFGIFSLAYAAMIFLVGAARSMVGEVLLVRTDASDLASQNLTRAVLGTGVILGLTGLLVMLPGALLQPKSGVWLALALALPFLVLQELSRFLFIARGQPARALTLDLVWALFSVVTFGLSLVLTISAPGVLRGWIAGAVVSVGVLVAMTRVTPDLRGALAWLVEARRLSARFFLESTTLGATNLLVWYILVIPLGNSGIAALRGVQLLFSPLNTVFNSFRVAMIPELVRSIGTRRYRRRVWELGVGLSVVALVWGGAVLLMPDSVGIHLLGETWELGKGLRLQSFVQYLALAAYVGLLGVFRAHISLRASSSMRAVFAVSTLTLPALLASPFGTEGAAWGFAVAGTLAALWGGVAVLRRADQREVSALRE